MELGAEPGVREIDGDDHEMAWSADGSRFTTGRGLLLDTRSFSVLSSPEILDKDGQGTGAGFYPKSSFSADGETFLVTNAQSRMWFLDARSGKVKKVTREFVASPATGSTTSYWSPTGASLLAVADPGAVRLMTGRGNVVKLLPESANSVLWSPRSTHFLLESMTAGLLLYKADGALVKKLAPPSSEEPGPVELRFSGDGRMIVARKKILREDGSMVRSLDGVTSLDFSPDNRSLAWTDARGVWVGPLKGDGSMLRPVQPSEALEVRWLPDGKRLLLENNQRIEVWDIESKKIAFPAVTKEPASDARAAAGPDGWFAIPGRGVKLLRVRDGKQLDVFVEQDKKHSTVLLAGRDGSFCGDKELATRHLSPPPGSPPTARPCPEILAAP